MIIVLGSSGQIASELKRFNGVLAFGRSRLNLCDLPNIYGAIESLRPTAVINAAAYTAVAAAESEAAAAHVINASAPYEVARVCKALDVPLVHISTDYVFDGNHTRPYTPKDECNPRSVYGASKRVGEEAIIASGCRYVILRTSWVFSRHGVNFVKTMLKLGRDRGQLSVVDDQIGGPTPAAAVADTCVAIAMRLASDRNISGVFHYSGAPAVSWFQFAQEIFRLCHIVVDLIPVATDTSAAKVERPKYSVLDCQSTYDQFLVSQPDWRAGLLSVLTELGEVNGET